MLANLAMNYLVSGKVPKRIGNAHANIVPYQVFPAADGYVIVATGNDRQYVNFCKAVGAPELARIRITRTTSAGSTHREELIAKLTA